MNLGVGSFEHLFGVSHKRIQHRAVNQVAHRFFSQRELRKADKKHGIITQAWSPIGGVSHPAAYSPSRSAFLRQTAEALTARRARYGCMTIQAALVGREAPPLSPGVLRCLKCRGAWLQPGPGGQ